MCYNRDMKRFLMAIMVMVVLGAVSLPTSAIDAEASVEREKLISSHCDLIKDSIKTVQRDDSRTRVYLGGYYEAVISKFVTPLNVKLVEESLSNVALIENQNNLSEARALFSKDFIKYQKSLEELAGIDCKNEPGVFYTQLLSVRKKRKTMNQDVARIRSLISEHVKLVKELTEELQ